MEDWGGGGGAGYGSGWGRVMVGGGGEIRDEWYVQSTNVGLCTMVSGLPITSDIEQLTMNGVCSFSCYLQYWVHYNEWCVQFNCYLLFWVLYNKWCVQFTRYLWCWVLYNSVSSLAATCVVGYSTMNGVCSLAVTSDVVYFSTVPALQVLPLMLGTL